jgi:hypothetical protein
MILPTVNDRLKFRDAERDLLRDLDRVVREAIVRSELEASRLGLDDRDMGMARVTRVDDRRSGCCARRLRSSGGH